MPAKPKIIRTSVTDQVCESIKEQIRKGEYKVGQLLPSESKLAELYGVNKLTIRIALQRLNALGILDTQTGVGTYVKDFDFNDYIQEVFDFYAEPELVNQISEYRQVIEVTCSELACERRTEEDLKEFAEIYQAYKDAWPDAEHPETAAEFEKIAEADIDFHRHICKMSHNKLFLYAFTIAERTLREYMMMLNKKRVTKWRETGDISYALTKKQDTHGEIYQAIVDGDVEKVRAYYTAMINPEDIR